MLLVVRCHKPAFLSDDRCHGGTPERVNADTSHGSDFANITFAGRRRQPRNHATLNAAFAVGLSDSSDSAPYAVAAVCVGA
jgi:hypothetical protein